MTCGKGVCLASGGALVVVPPLVVFNTNVAVNVVYLLCFLGVYALVTRPWAEVDRATRIVLVAIAAFLLSALITNVVSGADASGLRYFESIHAKVLAIFPLILLMRWAKPSPGWFWWGALLGSYSAGIYALMDLYNAFGFDVHKLLATPDFRVRGGTHPVIFGMLVASLTLLAASGRAYFVEQTVWVKVAWLAGVGAGLFATLLTNTRSAWLGLLLALGVTMWLRIRHLSGTRRWAFLMAMLLVPLGLYQIPRVESRVSEAVSDVAIYFERTARGEAVEGSIGPRFEMWRTAVFIASEHPWFGAGLGRPAYQRNAERLVSEQRVDPVVALYQHAHSQYFHTLATRGVIGLLTELALVLLCMALFVRHIRQSDAYQRQFAMTGLLLSLAYLIYGLSDVPLEHKNVLLLYVYATGVLLGLAGVSRAKTEPDLSSAQRATLCTRQTPGYRSP